jgi:hypothetical protein
MCAWRPDTGAVSRSERVRRPKGCCHGLLAMVGASTSTQCSCHGARSRSRHWSRPSVLCYLSILLCISTSCIWSADAFALHTGTRLAGRITRIPYAYRNVRSLAGGKDARNEGGNKKGPSSGVAGKAGVPVRKVRLGCAHFFGPVPMRQVYVFLAARDLTPLLALHVAHQTRWAVGRAKAPSPVWERRWTRWWMW